MNTMNPIQFDYNMDHPLIDPMTGNPTINPNIPRQPMEFPFHQYNNQQQQYVNCMKITTRIYHPIKNEIMTVPNVLIRTISLKKEQLNQLQEPTNGMDDDIGIDFDDDDPSSSDDNYDDDTSMEGDDDDDDDDQPRRRRTRRKQNQQKQQDEDDGEDEEEYAFWIQRTIREAIYGRVYMAIILRKRNKNSEQHINEYNIQNNNNNTINNNVLPQNVDWYITSYHCAVKEMSWSHIYKNRNRLAEDPIKEVAAMHYLKQYYYNTNIISYTNSPTTQQIPVQQQQSPTTKPINNTINMNNNNNDYITNIFNILIQTNIMIPIDLLSDDRYLYSIMPYCNGGELFELLDIKETFTESESKYWFIQILNGIENLQHAGICHRDISLENLLVHHETNALIIDMGMCLLLPYVDDDSNTQQPPIPPPQMMMATTSTTTATMMNSFENMNIIQQQQQQQQQQQNTFQQFASTTNINIVSIPTVNGNMNNVINTINGNISNTNMNGNTNIMMLSKRYKKRCMVYPQGTCGKWIYMSPEIVKNKEPFDGYAIDMWAVGVILFLMLTGFPPWERADMSDERFKYMSSGYLIQMLTEWETPISKDAMDLLQRMLFYDPKDRLSLYQVREHPWMKK